MLLFGNGQLGASCDEQISPAAQLLSPYEKGVKQLNVSDAAFDLLGNNQDDMHCEGDPLTFPWLHSLISSLVLNYCDSCLTITQAVWNDMGVIEVNWDAGNCGISDSGFWTVYSCEGDTLMHCETTIAGLSCNPDSVMLTREDLADRDTIWQCSIGDCTLENFDVLCQPWLVDSLTANLELCGAICIEGNSGNFVYRHEFRGRTLIEFRTTCGGIDRHFFDCNGRMIFSCSGAGFGSFGFCDSSISLLSEGELIWDCSQPIKGSTTLQHHQDSRIDVFPTVFDHILNLRLNQDHVEEMIVTDATGKNILRTNDFRKWIDPTYCNVACGNLFFNISCKSKESSEKVMKIN